MDAALDAAIATGPRPQPAPTRKLMPDAVMGMVLFVFTEAMLFAGLISAHTIVRALASEWPPAGQPRLPFRATIINTAALLASGAILAVAHRTYRKRPADAVGPMLLSLAFGAFFVLFQGREWAALLAEGLTLTSSPYASFFYVIVGMHALHAVGALGALGWAWLRLRAGRLSPAQLGAVALLWYFVVLVWPVLYARVYL
jgi:cytochrome c oxidase subunit 3